MPVKVLARSGRGSYSDIADGIYWAADHGAHVINLSLGGSVDSVVLEDACNHAWNAGVVIVASAGNESSSEPHYPSAYPVCISVSATTSADTLASYSNFGADVDLAAPGGDGTDRDGDGYGDGVLQNTFNRRNEEGYYFYTGTSMAAPHVAGVAALVKSADPALTAAEIRLILEDTAENIGDPWLFGNGLVDAEAAVTAAIGAVVNELPIADFSFLASNLRVDFTDTSVDFDGTIVERWWSFGDGTSSTDANPEHIFASDGVYSVSLTVVDDDGGLDAVSQAVTVSSPATRGEAKMYVGDVAMSGRAQGVNFSATGVVTVLGNGGVPVAGATVVAAWSGVVSGDATGVTAADGTVTLDSPRVTTPGTFTLTVTGLEHADYSYHPRLDIVTEGTVTLD
jgi:serine protease